MVKVKAKPRRRTRPEADSEILEVIRSSIRALVLEHDLSAPTLLQMLDEWVDDADEIREIQAEDPQLAKIPGNVLMKAIHAGNVVRTRRNERYEGHGDHFRDAAGGLGPEGRPTADRN